MSTALPQSQSFRYKIYNRNESGDRFSQNRLNRSFDISDSPKYFERRRVLFSNGPQRVERSFNTSYPQTGSNRSNLNRSFDVSPEYAAHETKRLERSFQNRGIDNSFGNTIKTTSRSGTILDRSPERRIPDSDRRDQDNWDVNHSPERVFERRGLSASFHSARDPTFRYENRFEKSYDSRPHDDMTVRPGVNRGLRGISLSHSFGPDISSYRDMPREMSNETVNKSQSSNKSIALSSQSQSTMSTTMRDILNKRQDQSQLDNDLTLDVVYITERIISMTFASDSDDNSYTQSLRDVVQMLKTKHGDNYLILNLSEKRQDLIKANPQVKEFGWPDHLAPPLERLCSLCKAIDSWLNADIRNVVILHCKGGNSRIASVIAAYMHYSNICASADQALDRFAMKLFYDDKLGGLPLPSQRRYVRYFSGLLSGVIKINSNALYLHHILIHGVPNFDTKGGCRPFIKVYQGMQPIFTSGVYNVTDNMQKVCISISPGIPLRGDILIKCYHKKTRSGQREVMWQCQFHTCAISDNSLVFSKHELDDAVLDPRFPDNGKVEFVFGPSSDILVSVSGFKSDVTVPVDDNEESLVRSDSYEDFNRALEGVDGYAGHGTSYNSPYSSSATTSNIINNNIISPSYSSQTHHISQNQQQNTSRRTVQTVEERTQLDELLSDLLCDQAYVSPNQRSPRSFQTAVQSQHHTPISPTGQNINISTNPAMSNIKTYNTATRSYTTYSTSDAHRNPDKLLIQRAEVSYKVPGQGEVKDHYTIAADPNDLLDTTTSSKPSQPYHPKGVPVNAFSYTAGLSSSQQSSSQRSEVIEREVIRSQPSRSLQSPPSSVPVYHTPSSGPVYQPEYDSKFDTGSSSYTYSSLDENTSAWLQQQQQKLKNFKEGRDSTGRTEQEKKLVNELRYAQNKYYAHRDESADEELVGSSHSRQAVQNGPTSPERITSSYSAPQRSQVVVDGQWPPQDQYYNTSYSTSSYSESRSYGDKRSNKPPPSPIMQRSQPVSSVPMPIPTRTSSKDYMRTRSNSSTSWQQQQQPPPPQRPLQRQQSDTIYDRNQHVEHISPKTYGSTHSTPPISPRAHSPSGPHSTTTYTTYRTIDRQRDAQEEMLRAKRAALQQAPPPQQPPTQINHHYITEVFVHRTDLNKDKTDSSTRLDELEKNLEAASQSIKSSQQQTVRHVPQQQQVFEESLQSHSSRQFHTYQETKPEPPRIKEIEEDRIMLRPIGPGMQTLEPETAHTGTLGRPLTPGFPIGPVGGSQFISPTGTLQQPLQQQQHQTIQYQHYQVTIV